MDKVMIAVEFAVGAMLLGGVAYASLSASGYNTTRAEAATPSSFTVLRSSDWGRSGGAWLLRDSEVGRCVLVVSSANGLALTDWPCDARLA